MLRLILARALSRFETTWSYDASYLRTVLSVSPVSFLKFSLVSGIVPRTAAPPDAIAAATLVATLAEDCGPCVQIATDQARASGVDGAILRAIVTNDPQGMGPDAALACRFANATLSRDLESADEARQEVLQRWGQAGLVALGLAMTTARLYPTLKYALGHGRSCSRISFGEDEPFALREQSR